MRFIAILFLVAFTPKLSQCQVTLNASDYPSVLTGIDTLRVTTAASLFPAFSTSTPGMWDMTLTTDSSDFVYRYRNSMSGVSFSDSVSGMLGSFSAKRTFDFNITTSALENTSVRSYYTAFDLSSSTGGASDTLFILSNTSITTPVDKSLLFPATNGSSWNTSFFWDEIFELSYSTFFYLHEPGYMRTYTGHNNVVTNWGKMRVRDASGAPSPYIDVLQVQTTTITTDSAFLSGGPMPGHIQLLLGITQGKKDTVYSQSYYRVGEVTPLAYVEFTDATFSHAIRAKTHVQRLTTGVASTSGPGPVVLFPNPAATTVEITDAERVFRQYEIADLAGRAVQHGSLSKSSSHKVSLNAGLSNGYYIVRLSTDSGKILTGGFIISK